LVTAFHESPKCWTGTRHGETVRRMNDTRSTTRSAGRGVLGVLALCAAMLVLPGAAPAEVRGGSGADPGGDFEIPQRDITATELTYDTQGSASATITLAAPPDAASLATGYGVLLGNWDGERCALEVVAHAATPAGANTFIEHATTGRLPGVPTLSASGNTVTVTAADPGFADKPYNCGGAESADPGNPAGGQDLQEVIHPLDATAAAGAPKKLRSAIQRCKRKHKRAKRARKSCIRRAHKKHG
jgi:hypothetical protein